MVAVRRAPVGRNSPSSVAKKLIQLRDNPEYQTALRAKLARNVASYELRYGIPSIDIRSAVAAGRLKETFEVCQWANDYDVLQRSEKRPI